MNTEYDVTEQGQYKQDEPCSLKDLLQGLCTDGMHAGHD